MKGTKRQERGGALSNGAGTERSHGGNGSFSRVGVWIVLWCVVKEGRWWSGGSSALWAVNECDGLRLCVRLVFAHSICWRGYCDSMFLGRGGIVCE